MTASFVLREEMRPRTPNNFNYIDNCESQYCRDSRRSGFFQDSCGGSLSGPGPFTVFAPTDDSFAKLPPGTVDALLLDIPKLTSILTYHVVSGSVPASVVV